MDRKVMEMSHMAPRKLLVTSCLSWYLAGGAGRPGQGRWPSSPHIRAGARPQAMSTWPHREGCAWAGAQRLRVGGSVSGQPLGTGQGPAHPSGSPFSVLCSSVPGSPVQPGLGLNSGRPHAPASRVLGVPLAWPSVPPTSLPTPAHATRPKDRHTDTRDAGGRGRRQRQEVSRDWAGTAGAPGPGWTGRRSEVGTAQGLWRGAG